MLLKIRRIRLSLGRRDIRNDMMKGGRGLVGRRPGKGLNRIARNNKKWENSLFLISLSGRFPVHVGVPQSWARQIGSHFLLNTGDGWLCSNPFPYGEVRAASFLPWKHSQERGSVFWGNDEPGPCAIRPVLFQLSA